MFSYKIKYYICIKQNYIYFSYLESLLAEKKKEIQELHQRIERDSVDMLLQSEIKHKIAKQLQYWQYKAMYMEVSTFIKYKTIFI